MKLNHTRKYLKGSLQRLSVCITSVKHSSIKKKYFLGKKPWSLWTSLIYCLLSLGCKLILLTSHLLLDVTRFRWVLQESFTLTNGSSPGISESLFLSHNKTAFVPLRPGAIYDFSRRRSVSNSALLEFVNERSGSLQTENTASLLCLEVAKALRHISFQHPIFSPKN